MRSRSTVAAVARHPGFRARRRGLREERARHRRHGPESLQDLHRGADAPSRRSTPNRSSPTAWSTAPSTACCRRSIRIRASWTRGPTRRCASGRKAATTGSASPFSRVDGDITAVRVFEGSPAFTQRHPPRRRDREVEGASTKGWTTEATVNKLKGPKGTFVNIGVRRKGFERLLEMRVMRDQVSIPSLSASFMIDGDDRLRRRHRLRRAHRRGSRRRARGADQEGHEAPGVRPARQPRRPARSGDSHRQPFHAQGLDGRLHARPRAEFGFGLSRHRAGRVPDHPDGDARQSQQRERVGNRLGRAAGLRPLARRRRDDVRQGAGAVGVSRQRRRRPRADHRALLHAERPPDSASVGRHVRRVPHLHDEGSEGARRSRPTS